MAFGEGISVETLCRRLKPILGDRVDEIYFRYSMAETPEERTEIVQFLNALYQKNLNKLLDKNILLEPPNEKDMEGEYKIADVAYSNKKIYDFNLREEDWQRHVCISGMSGSGKTTLALNLSKELVKHDKPFLVFDWKKSFRPLLLIDQETMCFTIGNEKVSNLFKTNLTKPPKGVAPKEWINVLCDLLTESFAVSFGVHKILLETLDEAFKEWGIYEGTENYPTWRHIKWRLEQKADKSKGREESWVESALRIATVLTFGDFGEVLNYKKENAIDFEELLNKRVIFELNSLGNIEKKFFCEYILTYLYKYKKANQTNIGRGFDHALVVDEAHNIFLKEKTNFVQESVTDMIYREMREYGTSLICLDQHISKLSDTVKGNSACHIAFQQQLPQDILDISELMHLKEEKELFSHLPVGTAVVKLSERYTYPFLVEVDASELRSEEVSDKKVKDRTLNMLDKRDFEKGKDKKFSKKLVKPELKHERNYVGVENVKEVDEEPQTEEQENNSRGFPTTALDQFDFVRDEGVLDDVQENIDEGMEAAEEIANEAITHRPRETMEREIVEEINKPKDVGDEPIKDRVLDDDFPFKEDDEISNLRKKVREKEDLGSLTDKQKVLYEFVKKKLASGMSLGHIEDLLNERVDEGVYREVDVLKVINFALEKEMIEEARREREEHLDKIKKPTNEVEEVREIKPVYNLPEKPKPLVTTNFDEKHKREEFERKKPEGEKVLDSLKEENDKEKPLRIGLARHGQEERPLRAIDHAITHRPREELKKEHRLTGIKEGIAKQGKEEKPIVKKEKPLVKKKPKKKVAIKNDVLDREDLSEEEKKFLKYLKENPDHEESTVSLYKLIGFSPRKGNKIKNELLRKNLVKIQEKKYDKGWKKFIKPNF